MITALCEFVLFQAPRTFSKFNSAGHTRLQGMHIPQANWKLVKHVWQSQHMVQTCCSKARWARASAFGLFVQNKESMPASHRVRRWPCERPRGCYSGTNGILCPASASTKRKTRKEYAAANVTGCEADSLPANASLARHILQRTGQERAHWAQIEPNARQRRILRCGPNVRKRMLFRPREAEQMNGILLPGNASSTR